MPARHPHAASHAACLLLCPPARSNKVLTTCGLLKGSAGDPLGRAGGRGQWSKGDWEENDGWSGWCDEGGDEFGSDGGGGDDEGDTYSSSSSSSSEEDGGGEGGGGGTGWEQGDASDGSLVRRSRRPKVRVRVFVTQAAGVRARTAAPCTSCR